MKKKEELLFELKEKLLRDYYSIERGYSVLRATDVAPILEGVAHDIPVAGFLSIFLYVSRVFPNQHSEPLYPKILELTRRYVASEIKKSKISGISTEGWFVERFKERFDASTEDGMYQLAMFDFAQDGLPLWFLNGPLNTIFRRYPLNLIERLANDDILSYKNKIDILSYLNKNYKLVFESLLGQIQTSKSKKLFYQYFLVCAHRLAIKNNFLEAIDILQKISDPTSKEYHTARYAISLYTRTLLAYNLENILTVTNKIKVIQFTHAKMLQLLENIPNKNIEYLYSDVLVRQIIPDGFPAIANVDCNKFDIRFNPGQPKLRSFLRKCTFFTGGAAVMVSGAVHYFQSAISYQRTFKYFWTNGMMDSINCRYDRDQKPIQPTSWTLSIIPPSLFTTSYLLSLIASFHFAYRFGVTKEKKYLGFAIALVATAIGLCITSNLVADWWQSPLAKAQGYNWPWTFDKVGCPARYPFDHEFYMASLEVKQQDHFWASMMCWYGELLMYIFAFAAVYFGFKQGGVAAKVEVVNEDKHSTFALSP